jgi:hypothetical protein
MVVEALHVRRQICGYPCCRRWIGVAAPSPSWRAALLELPTRSFNSTLKCVFLCNLRKVKGYLLVFDLPIQISQTPILPCLPASKQISQVYVSLLVLEYEFTRALSGGKQVAVLWQGAEGRRSISELESARLLTV